MNHQKTQAIETYYKNTRFRSRLEAKWALFFDELGIMWDYECQGFESRGVRYLPDFYLPELDYLFEVKPYAPSVDDFKKSAIGVEASGTTLLLSWGYPSFELEASFEMINTPRFYIADTKHLPLSEIKLPSMSDRFGMIGICSCAAETLLGDAKVIRLCQEQFRVGGLESAELRICPACRRAYFDTFWSRTSGNHDDSWLCPFDCERDYGSDIIAAAATKARNHRFGKIA